MRYVILRDDDTNALTPIECLERLYRPFLRRGQPVNLAVIPRVRTDVVRADGQAEGFLFARKAGTPSLLPVSNNGPLVQYLHENPGFHVVQHGYHHTLNEFDSDNAADVDHRLELGAQALAAAGFPRPTTFVAPYDKLSRVSVRAVSQHFRVLSTGWFELRRIPILWWPKYALKKLLKRPHWRIRNTVMMSHPGCLLSYTRPYAEMLDQIKRAVGAQQITVLVTHWWEYFRDGKPDEDFIYVLHEAGQWLASQRDVRIISFDDLAAGNVAVS
jgi:hypothetical protein